MSSVLQYRVIAAIYTCSTPSVAGLTRVRVFREDRIPPRVQVLPPSRCSCVIAPRVCHPCTRSAMRRYDCLERMDEESEEEKEGPAPDERRE